MTAMPSQGELSELLGEVAVEGPPVRLGIVGLGLAGAIMARAAALCPGVQLCAGAEPHAAPRAAFARDFEVPVYEDASALCEDPQVQAVYVATPHQYHAAHAVMAARAGKHIVLEKPMALSLSECDEIIAAVDRYGVHLMVGHTHAYDPAIRVMRRLLDTGRLGRVGMIATFNYTDFLYRPRRPEELDTSRGGGIVFNQLPHQIDLVRLLAGGVLRSVRASCCVLSPSRPTEGGAIALLDFADGPAASIVYSGHDYFDSDEFHDWVGEGGDRKTPQQHGRARRALASSDPGTEAVRRTATLAYGGLAPRPTPAPFQPHFGTTIVTCERGELKVSPDGFILYDAQGARPIALPPGSGYEGLFTDLRAAVLAGQAPRHGGRWGKATAEAMLALLQSSRERREIPLMHQVATPTAQD